MFCKLLVVSLIANSFWGLMALKQKGELKKGGIYNDF